MARCPLRALLLELDRRVCKMFSRSNPVSLLPTFRSARCSRHKEALDVAKADYCTAGNLYHNTMARQWIGNACVAVDTVGRLAGSRIPDPSIQSI